MCSMRACCSGVRGFVFSMSLSFLKVESPGAHRDLQRAGPGKEKVSVSLDALGPPQVVEIVSRNPDPAGDGDRPENLLSDQSLDFDDIDSQLGRRGVQRDQLRDVAAVHAVAVGSGAVIAEPPVFGSAPEGESAQVRAPSRWRDGAMLWS